MTLFWYELKKTCKEKWLLACFAILFLVCFVISFYQIRTERQGYSEWQYSKEARQYDGLSYAEAITRLEEQDGSNENNPVVSRVLMKEMNQLGNYDSYLKSLQEGDYGLGKISFFNEDKYISRLNEKNQKDYEAVTAKFKTYNYNVAADFFLRQRTPELFGAIFGVLVLLFLFTEEDAKEYSLLTQTTKKGRKYHFACKVIVMLCINAVALITFYAGMLFFLTAYLGKPNWSTPIQSIQTFMACRWNITVLEAVILVVMLKCLVYTAIFMIMSALTVFLKKSIILLASCGGIVLTTVLINQLISDTSIFAWLKNVSLFSVTDTARLLLKNPVIRMFDIPLPLFQVACIMMILFAVTAGWIGICKYGKIHKRIIRISKRKMYGEIAEKGYHPSLYRQEMHKIFLTYRMWIPVLLLGILAMWNFKSAHEIGLGQEEKFYQEYMLQLNGPVTEEKEAFLTGEAELLSNLEEYRDEILQDPNQSFLLPYVEEMLVKRNAFERVKDHYARIEANPNVDVFLYEEGFLYLLGVKENRESGYRYLIGLFALILLLPYCSFIEYGRNANNLTMTTVYGRGKLLRARILCQLFLAVVVMGFYYICDDLLFLKQFGTYGIWNSIQNIYPFSEGNINLPIGVCLLFIVMLRVAGIALLVLFCIWISSRYQNYLKSTFLLGLIFLLPFLLVLFNFEPMKYVPWNLLLDGRRLLVLCLKGGA